jgi:hypothetical protein
MLIELWERFCGYDRWVLVEATIESSQMEDNETTYRGQTRHVYDSGDTLVWIDRQGNRQTGFCRVPDDSPLYQLVGGEKIAIRFNPDKPEEYYLPELLKARLRHNLSQLVFLVLFISLILVPALVFVHVFKK